jgi:sugar-specific transcriptional regulator TrmB
MAVDLLQRLGLNKYEADAYFTLLAEGPLTGYEVGKRSSVPLSRSYETLERLARRGLVLLQPGEPPHYLAERPERFMAQTRADHERVLGALAAVLAEHQRAEPAEQFWVTRGRANIIAQARAMIAEAETGISLGSSHAISELNEPLRQAQARGCPVVASAVEVLARTSAVSDLIVLLAEATQTTGTTALVGTLAPAADCQAVVSGNPALVTAVRLALRGRQSAPAAAHSSPPSMKTADPREAAWIDWEARKQERLRRIAQAG